MHPPSSPFLTKATLAAAIGLADLDPTLFTVNSYRAKDPASIHWSADENKLLDQVGDLLSRQAPFPLLLELISNVSSVPSQ